MVVFILVLINVTFSAPYSDFFFNHYKVFFAIGQIQFQKTADPPSWLICHLIKHNEYSGSNNALSPSPFILLTPVNWWFGGNAIDKPFWTRTFFFCLLPTT